MSPTYPAAPPRMHHRARAAVPRGSRAGRLRRWPAMRSPSRDSRRAAARVAARARRSAGAARSPCSRPARSWAGCSSRCSRATPGPRATTAAAPPLRRAAARAARRRAAPVPRPARRRGLRLAARPAARHARRRLADRRRGPPAPPGPPLREAHAAGAAGARADRRDRDRRPRRGRRCIASGCRRARSTATCAWRDANNALLILDIQPGRSAFLPEARQLERWLREPDVGARARPRMARDLGRGSRARDRLDHRAGDQRRLGLAGGPGPRRNLPQKLLLSTSSPTT